MGKHHEKVPSNTYFASKMLTDFDNVIDKINFIKNSDFLERCFESMLQEQISKIRENSNDRYCEPVFEVDDLEVVDFDLMRIRDEISTQTYIDGQSRNFEAMKKNINWSSHLIRNMFEESTLKKSQFESVSIEKIPNFKDLMKNSLQLCKMSYGHRLAQFAKK